MVAGSNNAHGGQFNSEGIDHYLVDFLEQVYAPTMLRGRGERYVAHFREAVSYLGDALRRQPRLSDLNEISFKRWRERIQEFSVGRRETLSKALRAMWRLAYQLGRASPPSESRGTTGRPKLPTPVGEPGTLVDFYNTTYAPQAIAHTGNLHRAGFLKLLRRLRQCFGRDLLLQELSGKLLAEYVQWMREAGLSACSVKNERTRLLGIWRYAHDRWEAPEPPRVPKLKVPREQPDAWSLEEVSRIIQEAGRLRDKPIEGIPANKYWVALLLVAWYTALRRGSLLSIRPEHLDLDQRWLYVPADAMKNFVGKRYRIGEDAAAALREIWGEREFVFALRDRTDHRLRHQPKKILKAAAVAPSRMKLNWFHKMRRTTATHVAVKAGLAAASALLGHSSAVLLKRYIDPTYMVGTDATEWLASPSIS